MIHILLKFYKVLNINQKKRFVFLQFLVAVSSIFEVLTVAYLGFFMSTIGRDIRHSNLIFNLIEEVVGVSSQREFEKIVVLLLFLCLTISTLLSISSEISS